jgi:hypothetical protein
MMKRLKHSSHPLKSLNENSVLLMVISVPFAIGTDIVGAKGTLIGGWLVYVLSRIALYFTEV